MNYLSGDYLTIAGFNSNMTKIRDEPSDTERIKLINLIINRVFLTIKSTVIFWRGKSYAGLAIADYNLVKQQQEEATETPGGTNAFAEFIQI